jgi:hypothetical protein
MGGNSFSNLRQFSLVGRLRQVRVTGRIRKSLGTLFFIKKEKNCMKTITVLAIIYTTLLVACAPTSVSMPTATPDLSNVPADIPIYPEYTNFMHLSNSIGYLAQADLQTVTQFYQTEMLNQGWTQSKEPITYAAAAIVLHYEKADRKVQIFIEDEKGETSVGIGIAP